MFIFTDGEFRPLEKKHSKNIIWCITPDGRTDRIPKSSKDKIVKAE